MVKKKSTKKIETFDYKALSMVLGVATVGLAIATGWLASTRISYQESQELQAFKGLASSYIYEQFYRENEQTANMTGIGVTDDRDLYVDFVITKYEEHVPMATKDARLHFQCNQKTDRESGCAQAFWYGEWEDTGEEYRTAYREYIDAIESSVEAYNAAETDEERAEIEEQRKALYEKYKDILMPKD